MESGSSIVVTNQKKVFEGIKIENPFTFKAFQVFTGFGFGCGIGIGVGSPINLGAIPVVNQVMSAAGGATYAFSGASRHVNDVLRKMGAKNIQAGIGCGVGLGHGLGIGLAVKPGVMRQIQFCAMQAMTKLMVKFGMAPNLSISQGGLPMSLQSGLPMSLQSGTSMISDPTNQNPLGNIMQLATKVPEHTSEGLPRYGSSPVDPPFGSRTEKVISGFLQNPVLKEESSHMNELAGQLRSENNMLQMVLKHQQVIEDLMEENEKLRQILMEDLKIPPSKLQASPLSRNKSPCTDCFECRRKQRKR